ncbi:hypothetical protein [Aeromonas veronii]|uniref:hypothetical protein n=1 Tax=Aeromonas veronii TaxID=654 RepID=UPI001BCC9E35|nr:hypothetical protein [Aeromonas veronii]MBS4705153.1 hypothetical protein [Aeromonas veronii]QWL60624.1 hypothetical protein HQ400_21370 [Aeromonas jandaei]
MKHDEVIIRALAQATSNGEPNKGIGAVGATNRMAKNYWDRKLGMKEVCILLNITVSALKVGIATGTLPDGRPCPKVVAVTGSRAIFFDGIEVKAAMYGMRVEDLIEDMKLDGLL